MITPREANVGTAARREGPGAGSMTRRFVRALCCLTVPWALAGACHDVGRHVGEACDSDRDCRDPYVCALGACRAECDVDRDCDGGACLVVDEHTRVCTLADERGCGAGSSTDCPPGFECGVDRECRNPCNAEQPCPADRRCVEGTCFDAAGGGATGHGGTTGGDRATGGDGTTRGGATSDGNAAGDENGAGGGGTPGSGGEATGSGGTAGENGAIGPGGTAGEAGSAGAQAACTSPGGPIRSGGSLLDWAEAVAVSPDGSVFVGGQFVGETSFGESSLVSAGDKDAFLARYRPDRSLAWVRQAGGPQLDGIYSMAALGDGAVYVAGSFLGTATFGSISLTASGASSGFIAKYDAIGNVVWAKRAGGTTHGGGNAVAALSDGSAQFLGYFKGDWAYDDVEEISSPQGDAFLARYAPDGTLTWLKQTAGPGGSQPIGARSMAVSSDGSAYVTGDFGEPIQLGDTQLTVTGGDEAFVARYDEHGDVVWARQSNGQGYAVGFSVATIDDGSAYVAGEFGGSVSLGAKQLEGRGESGFVAKYLADGSVDWITTGTGRSAILSVVTDSDGSAYLTGGFSGAAAFGDIDFGGHLDDFSMFVAKLDPAGMPVWGQQAGGSSWGRAIALQRGCTPQVVGTFVGTWSFGSTQWSSRGQEDAFLVSLEPVVESRSIAVEPMSYARHAHTATLLQNQQVLVTGGFGSTAWLSSAELYDTSTRSWNPASSMLEARTNHTSSLLKNGKVLVAGGLSPQGAQPSGALTSAELYDPAEDAWESTGSLHEPRGQHTATVIQNGKVLVVGGVAATGINNLASAELYDPATRKWSAAGTLTAPRMQTTATLLLDGRVLVAGGINNAGPEFLSGCELYDPASNDWSPAAPLSQPRRDHAAVLLANGKVLVVAGDNTSGDLATAELYDPSTNTWQATGSLRAPRSEPTATLLLDGSVLLLGGARNSGPTFLSTVERYDPSRGVWRADTPMSHAHYSHTATLLDQGHVLVTGGFDGNDFVSNVDLYLPGQSTLDE